ncbi:Uncharacterized protein OBRU01_08161, partial [Operophtera brumata]
PCHAQLEFCVFLVSGATGCHSREARALRFWFKPRVPPDERFHDAQAFFRELVSPQDFPKAYIDDSVLNQTAVISEQRVLDLIEMAYPNPMNAEVKDALESLEEKGLTRAMSDGIYVRQHSVDTQVVKQMPTLCSSRQPSIAVITALYCEKQAVDAMMDNQETYVRYTTV